MSMTITEARDVLSDNDRLSFPQFQPVAACRSQGCAIRDNEGVLRIGRYFSDTTSMIRYYARRRLEPVLGERYKLKCKRKAADHQPPKHAKRARILDIVPPPRLQQTKLDSAVPEHAKRARELEIASDTTVQPPAEWKAAFVLLIDCNQNLLRVLPKKHNVGWEDVGGKREGNESPKQCLARELHEETGLSLSDFNIAGQVYNPQTKGYVFVATCDTAKPIATAHNEILRAEWIPLAQAREQAHFRLESNLTKASTLLASLSRGALAVFDTKIKVEEFDSTVTHVHEIHISPQQKLLPDGTVTHNRIIKPNTTLLIDAGCALGKSTQIQAFLQRVFEANPKARVCCISSRIIHAHDLCADYADCCVTPAMYKDYKGKEKQLVDQQFVIISLELAFYLQYCNTAFDVLILDEARSLCDKFAEQTTIKNPMCFDQLRLHYSRATYVIAADADCRIDNAVKYLLQMEPSRPVRKWLYHHQRLKRKMIVYFRPNDNSPPSVFKQAVMDLQPGEKLWVCAHTKSAVKNYGKFCQQANKTIAVYHGDVSYKTKQTDFAAPDVAWRDKDVVLSNICLTVAVDPKTTVFKKIFYHSSRFGGKLREGFQNLCRPNRHLTDTETEIICFLDCKDIRAVEAKHKQNPKTLKE